MGCAKVPERVSRLGWSMLEPTSRLSRFRLVDSRLHVGVRQDMLLCLVPYHMDSNLRTELSISVASSVSQHGEG